MFISLKIKAIILTSVLVLGLSTFFAVIGKSKLEQLYQSQRTESHARHSSEIDGLVSQSNIHLQQLTDLLPTLSVDNSNNNSIKEILNSHWEYLEINWSLVSASLFSSDSETTSSWGSDIDLTSLSNDIAKVRLDGSPISKTLCQQQCLQVLITPILGRNKKLNILILTRSIADTLRTFYQQSSANIGILTPITETTDDMKSLPHWDRQASAITNYKDTLPLLKKVSQNIDFTSLRSSEHTIEINSGSYQISLKPTVSGSTSSHYVIIEDVSAERDQIASSSISYIAAAIAAVVVFSLLIIIALWQPIIRLRKQAELMPLLSQGKFEYVREILALNNKKRWFKDEIDILDSSEINVSLQLEDMQDKIKSHNNELQQLVLYDTLTGLANRRALLEEIEKILKIKDQSFALLFLDLDNFKRINDSLGHQSGDELLKVVSSRLKSCVRGSDLVTRLGGDEFCILIRELRSPEDGRIIATNVLNILKNPLRLQTTEIIISASIGIVSSPENGVTTEDLLQNADIAMYQAKSKGRNKYQHFDPSMNEHAMAQLELENELRQALINKEFVLHYQPQIDLSNNTICSVEALIRWQHPTRGLLAPFHFIDPLEETGLIVPLGEWILLESCQAAKRWIDSGMVPIKVSVNLSSRQFQDPKLFSMIEQTLAITQLKAKYLELEITESMVMTDIENNNRALQQMQKLGISIAIDDFGTGYSSFSYLKALPLDTLKIDRSFVMDIPNDETDMEITAAIIAVAHKLKLNVVAEGIETKEQESFLTSEGCDIGQGYLFSKPIAEEELIKLLDKEIIEPSSAHVS